MDLEPVTPVGTADVADVVALFAQAWWTCERARADVVRMLANSPVTLGLRASDGRLVAFARALSDGVFKALVMDVIVLEEMRGQGVGHVLLTALLEHPLLARVEEIELYCNQSLEHLYGEFGFVVPPQTLFMRRRHARGPQPPAP